MVINHTFHKDVNVISYNKCKERNFYMPKRNGDKKDPFKNGKRFISLNGKYEFHYYKKDEVYKEDDTFDIVNVPACFQAFGYGNVCYMNDQYLFEINPPYIEDSDYGVYKKIIDFKKKDKQRYYINFEGKDSCLYLYVNGVFVGFDSVAHATSEFDITDYLVNGKNELLIFVYVYSVGSYFECQDKFRLSGLFRDVYIIEREENHIESYKISYVKKDNDIELTIDFESKELVKEVSVYDKKELIAYSKTNKNNTSLIIKNPTLWNAENPYLYLIEIKANNEVIYDYVGFRFVSLENGIFILNDRKVKLLGTNHHDSNYKTGYYLSLDDYKKDLLLMKKYNMNTIRTSHYPPSPEMLLLADKLGFYVVDEADIECHGIVRLTGDYDINNFDKITDNEVFKDVIHDRIYRMITRDYNRNCIIMWSGGNEAGYGKEMIKQLIFMKEYDPTRIIHYESTYTASPERNNYKLDMISMMYPSVDKIKDTLKDDNRPIFLCEYSHAMGNSCGDIHDYVEYFYKEDRAIGGCIWEFNDHLFPINLDYNKPGYGGDFNEPKHSGNFCVDGLVTYKREASTNLLEVGKAYSKVVIKNNGNEYYLENRYDFTNLKSIKVVVKDNNKVILENRYDLKARNEIKVIESNSSNLLFDVYVNNKYYESYSFTKKEDYKPSINSSYELVDNDNLTLKTNKLEVIINKETGLIKKVSKNNNELLSDARLLLYRANIDNDQYEIDKWKEEGLYQYKVELKEYKNDSEGLNIKIKIDNILEGIITYKLNELGLAINLELNVDSKIEYLPRLGYYFKVNRKLEKYNYEGYGPYESYVDKHHLDTYGKYKDNVNKKIMYVKPQETNSHLANSLNISNKIICKGMNSFSYLAYSVDELINKKHSYELVNDGYNYLSLDYMVSGVGSHACGPELDCIYKLEEKKINYCIELEVR